MRKGKKRVFNSQLKRPGYEVAKKTRSCNFRNLYRLGLENINLNIANLGYPI